MGCLFLPPGAKRIFASIDATAQLSRLLHRQQRAPCGPLTNDHAPLYTLMPIAKDKRLSPSLSHTDPESRRRRNTPQNSGAEVMYLVALHRCGQSLNDLFVQMGLWRHGVHLSTMWAHETWFVISRGKSNSQGISRDVA
jgi:hypothetical protein